MTETQPDLARARKQDGEKSNAFPTYAASSMVQDKRLHNHFIFEYIMIRPTSASKKIYSRQTLGLPFHCLNLALVVGEKKNKQERIHNKPLLTQVVDALYNRNQSLL